MGPNTAMSQPYFNAGYNSVNPYQYQTQQYSYFQPTQGQAPTLKGRVINCENDITPQEVAMDGSISYFPQANNQVIFAKQWNSDGTISTVKYILDQQQPQEEKPDPFKPIYDRLDSIDKKLGNYRNNQRQKKESQDE